VTFEYPFSLKGLDGPQAPGTYTVVTDEELIDGMSFPAYRRTATVISVPVPSAGGGSFQSIGTDPQELEAAVAADLARAVADAVPSSSDRPEGPRENVQPSSGRRFSWIPFRSGRPWGT
jgi:hypothetical protein